MELGIYTFGEVGTNPHTGSTIGPRQRLRDVIEEIEPADQVGLDVFGVGEHHRPDYAISAPAVVLAAAAERTRNIRLTSAVTVLGSDDPVRVFQDFATLDLLLGLRDAERVTWEGAHRPPLDDRGVYPRPVQEPLPVWIAVGGTPQSVVRAGVLGLPMALAIIGGMPERFVPLVELYRESGQRAGHAPANLRVSINSHGFVADTTQQAADISSPGHAEIMTRTGRERGWPPVTREGFDRSIEPRGALLVGDPQQVTEKILWEHELFGNDRFLLQVAIGPTDHRSVMRAIELYGAEVAPAVRKAVARGESAPLASSERERVLTAVVPPGRLGDEPITSSPPESSSP